ncbi:hypothetical protein VPNG_07109 [Cytospora leucostoma]|uniref:Uncharacterized protein n=1 Tax=Cytospora leucostoma TaxID=1230097 RepID=A0A423WVL9_9PEZI|nr:hypothetical protein VPNG_07109 [Cytospora leucostoma]
MDDWIQERRQGKGQALNMGMRQESREQEGRDRSFVEPEVSASSGSAWGLHLNTRFGRRNQVEQRHNVELQLDSIVIA